MTASDPPAAPATTTTLTAPADSHDLARFGYRQELERSLGVNLLDRSTRPLSVTPAGQIYLEFCRDLPRQHWPLPRVRNHGQDGVPW